jgi:hypothetical protein
VDADAVVELRLRGAHLHRHRNPLYIRNESM